MKTGSGLNKILKLTALSFVGLLSTGSYAGQVTYPNNSYATGDTLTAADLNAKFNQIKNAVNDNNRISAGVVTLAVGGDTPNTANTSATTLRSFTVNAPSAGTLIVTLSGSVLVDVDAPTAASVRTSFGLGLCTAMDSSATCGDTYQTSWYTDPDNASSFNDQMTVNRSRAIPVAAAGPVTVYVNGHTSAAGNPLYLWYPSAASVIFVPNSLSISVP